MKSKYNILEDVHVLEPTDESWNNFPSSKKAPTNHYENHLQKIEGGYIRYCYYDVKLSGRKYYGRRALIIPENINVELHLKALVKGVLNPELWEPFAQNVLKYTRAHRLFDEVQPYTPARDIDEVHPIMRARVQSEHNKLFYYFYETIKETLKIRKRKENPGLVWNIEGILAVIVFITFSITCFLQAIGLAQSVPDALVRIVDIMAAFLFGRGSMRVKPLE